MDRYSRDCANMPFGGSRAAVQTWSPMCRRQLPTKLVQGQASVLLFAHLLEDFAI